LAIGAAGVKTSPYAPALAELLTDTAEDETQDVNCIAGIELRPHSTLMIPACAALRALARIGDCSCARQVASLVKPEYSFDVRLMAAETLGEIGDDFESALLPLLDSPEVHLRAQALKALGKIAMRRGASSEVAEEARSKLSDRSPLVRAAAAEALGCMGDNGAAFAEDIFQLFVDRAVLVRVAAVRAMVGIGVKGQLFAAHICRQMYEDGPDVKIASAEALSAMGRRGAAFADEVATLADDHDSSVRIAALIALSKMGSDGHKYFLAEAEKARLDRLQHVRSNAAALLAKDCLAQERPSHSKKSVQESKGD
jgi:HEAT repeat protein